MRTHTYFGTRIVPHRDLHLRPMWAGSQVGPRPFRHAPPQIATHRELHLRPPWAGRMRAHAHFGTLLTRIAPYREPPHGSVDVFACGHVGTALRTFVPRPIRSFTYYGLNGRVRIWPLPISAHPSHGWCPMGSSILGSCGRVRMRISVDSGTPLTRIVPHK